MTSPTAAAELVLVKHQRTDNGGPCICGWNEIGRSHARHQVDELVKAGQLTVAPNTDQWLTTDGAAELLGVHPGTVYRYVDDGYLTRRHPTGPRSSRRPAGPMFWRADVEALAKVPHARRRRREAPPS